MEEDNLKVTSKKEDSNKEDTLKGTSKVDEKVVEDKGEVKKNQFEESKKEDSKKNNPDVSKQIEKAKKVIHKNTENLTEKFRENPWVLSTLVLGIVTLILLVGNFGATGNVVSQDDAGQIVLELAKAQVADAELVSVEAMNGLYQINLIMQGRDVPVYLTLDGENLVNGLTPIAALMPEESESSDSAPSSDVEKSDNPTAELFVMTHCPYGTQAEKGFVPAMRALGDSIDSKIRFVHYYMHTNDQEEVETPRQVCIREEQEDKFLDYLECFLGGSSGSQAEAAACEKEVGIDLDALEECISSGRGDEYYAEDSALSESYGVKGSPTLIINGAQSSAGRDAESYLVGMCNAFNDAPSECDAEVSSASPSPGFGYSAGGSVSAAQCG